MPKIRADEFRIWVLLLMLVAGPPVILQLIVEDAAIQTVNVGVNQAIPFGEGKMKIDLVDHVSVDTTSVGVYCKTYTSYRKNGRDDRHYEAYIVAPILTQAHGEGKLWFGKKITHIDSRDNSSSDEIHSKIQNIQDTSANYFRLMLKRFPIRQLEINTSTPAFRDFERAVANSGIRSTQDIIVATEVIQRKSLGFKLRAFIITLGITQSIWLIVCLFIRVNETRLKEHLKMTDNDHKLQSIKDFKEAFSWITPRKNYMVTPLLLIANVLVYLIMGIVGIGFDAPDNYEMIKWGSNYGPLVREGQVWRWLTAGFLHFGFVHILMNMFALGYAGYVMERVIGSAHFAILYFTSVIGSSISSSLVHHYFHNSAGASGGIFGILGAMLIYALFNVGRQENRTIMILLFAFFALPAIFVGLAGYYQVDNAGHFGGLITGGLVSLFFISKVNSARDVFEDS